MDTHRPPNSNAVAGPQAPENSDTPVGSTPEGYPVFLRKEARTGNPLYVARLPTGEFIDVIFRPQRSPSRLRSSQQRHEEPGSPAMSFAVLGGVVGVLLAGPAGALVGSALGALLGTLVGQPRAPHRSSTVNTR